MARRAPLASKSDGAITDRHVAAVLRVFVRGSRPVLHALRDADPFGLRRPVQDQLAETGGGPLRGAGKARRAVRDWLVAELSSARLPGTPAWTAMEPDRRADWWVGRVGRFTALLAAVPGVGGALADLLPVQDAVGAAGQGLVLCAIAGEYGVRDEVDQVRLLASVLFGRDLELVVVDVDVDDEVGGAAERPDDDVAAELDRSKDRHGRVSPRAVAGAVWRLGRILWDLGDELGKRPHGRWYHAAFGKLPLVGAAADYLGERSALRRAAAAAKPWIAVRAGGERGMGV